MLEKDIQEILFSEEQLASRVNEIARQITQDYQGKEIVLISVLRGSFVFMADLCRRMAADFDRLWAAGRPQGAGEYWPCPQKPDYTITAQTPPQETERILRAFFGFDCYLKTKETEYRIVRGVFRPEPHARPFGTVETRPDGTRRYAVRGGIIETVGEKEESGA